MRELISEEKKGKREEGGWEASFIGAAQPSATLSTLTLSIAQLSWPHPSSVAILAGVLLVLGVPPMLVLLKVELSLMLAAALDMLFPVRMPYEQREKDVAPDSKRRRRMLQPRSSPGGTI